VNFTFKRILLGKEKDVISEQNDTDEDEPKNTLGKRKKKTPKLKEISFSTLRNCTAIDFLVAHACASVNSTK